MCGMMSIFVLCTIGATVLHRFGFLGGFAWQVFIGIGKGTTHYILTYIILEYTIHYTLHSSHCTLHVSTVFHTR
jgi:hypothetical protein